MAARFRKPNHQYRFKRLERERSKLTNEKTVAAFARILDRWRDNRRDVATVRN